MSLIRSILLFIWAILIAAYGTKQAIHISVALQTNQSKELAFFFANEGTASLLFPAKDAGFKTLLKNPGIKWLIDNQQYILNISIRPSLLAQKDSGVRPAFYISKIIFPFHHFW